MKQEETRDVNSTHPRTKIHTRDAAVPFAENDHTKNGPLKYKFWDLSRIRPDIPAFPTGSKKTIVVTSRFIRHLEPPATAKFKFEQHDRTWNPQSINDTRLRGAAIRELCRQSGSEAPFGHPYFIGDNCDLKLCVQPQGLNESFRLRPGEESHRFLLQRRIGRKHANLELDTEVHIVLTESIPADEPTDEMINDVGRDQLHIRLTYDLRGIPKMKTMHQQSQMLHFHRTHSFQDLVPGLAEFVTVYLATNEPGYHAHLEKEKSEHCLLLRPVLIHSCPLKQRAFTFDDSGISRIAVVNDLLSATVDTEAAWRGEFDAMNKQTRQPQSTIELRLIDAVDQVVIATPLVVINPGAKEKKSGGVSRFYRIGSRVDPEAEEDRLVSLSSALFWSCKFGDDLTGLTIITASIWSLRGLDIYAPDEGRALGKNTPHLKKKTIEAPTDTERFEQELENGSLRPCTGGRLLYDFTKLERIRISFLDTR